MLLATDMSPLSSSQSDAAIRRFGRTSPEGHRECKAPRPPRGFRPLRGTISDVRFGGAVPLNTGRTPAQKAGLRYEQRVHDVLSAIYGANYRPAPSILFRDISGVRRAIPDGLLRVDDLCVLIEIKLSHTERAYWQLKRLYEPLLMRLVVPRTRIVCVELCRSYDPSVNFPGPHVVIDSLHDAPSDAVGVLQWRI